jgi:hypothetical protein
MKYCKLKIQDNNFISNYISDHNMTRLNSFIKRRNWGPALVAYTCHPSYLGGRDRIAV